MTDMTMEMIIKENIGIKWKCIVQFPEYSSSISLKINENAPESRKGVFFPLFFGKKKI